MFTTILAIDLGKFNSVLWYDKPTTRRFTFRTVKMTTPNWHAHCERLQLLPN